jgi:multidrug efflux pump subunit AcrA (membrane-fusion protein)
LAIWAYIVNMASEVSGRIVELNARDNQQVKEGQVLFQIDPKPYQLRVDQARAAVQGLEAQLAVTTSEVASQTSGAEAAASGISTAEAQLALATRTLDRLQPLLKRGFVMAEGTTGTTATPAPAAVAPVKFSIPSNTAVEFPPPAEIDGNRVYGLVELIDIAQRRNPATRVAWEEARQAAIKVGIAQAAYLPVLTASALADYERLAFPMPTNLVPAGFATSNNREVVPAASVKYLLLDFGGRAATVEEASQLSIAANPNSRQRTRS